MATNPKLANEMHLVERLIPLVEKLVNGKQCALSLN